MNRREVGEVLAQFSAAFRADVDDVAAEVWAAQLAGVDVDAGRQAAHILIRTLAFFPKVSEFVREATRLTPADRGSDYKAIAAGEPDESTQERIRAIIVEARAQVAERKGEHNHHGPSPCPVCGGINPDYSRKGQSAMRGEAS